MFDIVGCPRAGCDMPAEQWPLYASMNPAGQHIVHLRVLCVAGHTTFTEQAANSGPEETPPSACTA